MTNGKTYQKLRPRDSWKSGVVNGALPPERRRTVTLSRYAKVVGKVEDSKVAEMIAGQLNGLDIEVPFNVVTPSLREELVKRGVKIGEPEKGNAGDAARPAYEEWLKSQGGQERVSLSGEEESKGLKFFDNAERSVSRIQFDEAKAEDWLAKIRRTGGLNGDDNKILALDDWLENRKGKDITKKELMDLIQQSRERAEEFINQHTEEEKEVIRNREIDNIILDSSKEQLPSWNEAVVEDLSLYHMNMRKEEAPSNSNVGTSKDGLAHSDSAISVHKVKNLIHSTQEFDQKLLGLSKKNLRFSFDQENESYMEAAEKGDEETGWKLLMEAAKSAMPNTKVVDKDGNPLVVYHGTLDKFNVFDRDKTEFGAFHFATTKEGAMDAVLNKIYNEYGLDPDDPDDVNRAKEIAKDARIIPGSWGRSF